MVQTKSALNYTEGEEKRKPPPTRFQESSMCFAGCLLKFISTLFPFLLTGNVESDAGRVSLTELLALATLHIVKVGRNEYDDFAQLSMMQASSLL